VNLDEKAPEANVYKESTKDYSLARGGDQPCDAMGFKL